ncbi:MAG: hypothetical protein WC655_04175 [Candidatus Hydrogenedentales bacterium]|jgi:hypothetical protein
MTQAHEITLLKRQTGDMLNLARYLGRRLEELKRTSPAWAFNDVVYYLETVLHVWEFGRKSKPRQDHSLRRRKAPRQVLIAGQRLKYTG